MAGVIAKPYLHSRMGGAVAVKLNDGRCIVNESETLYYFRTSRKVSECGTEKQVSNYAQQEAPKGLFARFLTNIKKNIC